MVSDDMIVKEFVRLPKPEIDRLLRKVLEAGRRNIPSKSQLHRFRNLLLNRSLDDIENFLRQRIEIAGSEEWWRRSFDGKGLTDVLLESVAGPVKNLQQLGPRTDLWDADPYFLFRGGRQPANLTNEHRLLIARQTLAHIVDVLLAGKEEDGDWWTMALLSGT